MKSRLAITLMLVLGLVMSTAGAGMAVQNQGASDNAAETQYRSNDRDTDVLGEVGTVDETDDQGGSAPTNTSGSAPEDASVTDPVAQQEVAGDSGSLPFTGFASGTVLLLGLMLLASGFVLRHRLRDER